MYSASYMMFFSLLFGGVRKKEQESERDFSAMVKSIDILKLCKSLEMQKLQQLQHMPFPVYTDSKLNTDKQKLNFFNVFYFQLRNNYYS